MVTLLAAVHRKAPRKHSALKESPGPGSVRLVLAAFPASRPLRGGYEDHYKGATMLEVLEKVHNRRGEDT